jgi:hypothetical protein
MSITQSEEEWVGREVGVLLPAEPRSVELLEDAEHWAAVYEELVAFLVAGADVDLPPDRQERLERRLQFWRRRVSELRE